MTGDNMAVIGFFAAIFSAAADLFGFVTLLLVYQVPSLWLLAHIVLCIRILIEVLAILESFHVVFELLLRDLVDLVDHEDVILEAVQELVETGLGWPLLLRALSRA